MARLNRGSAGVFEELRSTVDLRITILGTYSVGGRAEAAITAWGSADARCSTRDGSSLVGTSAGYVHVRIYNLSTAYISILTAD